MGESESGRRPRVVVIGASAGGVEALTRLVRGLPADYPLPIVVVLHVPPTSSMLPEILSRPGGLPAGHAYEGEQLTAGRIYIAPPDCHLLVSEGVVNVERGTGRSSCAPGSKRRTARIIRSACGTSSGEPGRTSGGTTFRSASCMPRTAARSGWASRSSTSPATGLHEHLEHSKERLETAYEELQSTAEELETTNEELQSTNEELETMNEERAGRRTVGEET
jgi:CheB methylesterase